MMMQSSSPLSVGVAVGGRIGTNRRLAAPAAPSSDTLRRISHPDRSLMILRMILLLMMLLVRSDYRLYTCLSLPRRCRPARNDSTPNNPPEGHILRGVSFTLPDRRPFFLRPPPSFPPLKRIRESAVGRKPRTSFLFFFPLFFKDFFDHFLPTLRPTAPSLRYTLPTPALSIY